MAQFEKIYIGKGSKIKDLDIVRVSMTGKPGRNPQRPHGGVRREGILYF